MDAVRRLLTLLSSNALISVRGMTRGCPKVGRAGAGEASQITLWFEGNTKECLHFDWSRADMCRSESPLLERVHGTLIQCRVETTDNSNVVYESILVDDRIEHHHPAEFCEILILRSARINLAEGTGLSD